MRQVTVVWLGQSVTFTLDDDDTRPADEIVADFLEWAGVSVSGEIDD